MADNDLTRPERGPEPPPTETLLEGPFEYVLAAGEVRISIAVPAGQTVGIACRTAEKDGEVRTLTTIRTGREIERVKFDFGNYGGVQTFGGDPGSQPPCP